MDTATQGVPGYYVWAPEGRPVAVHLRLDVIDRLGPEVMRGFGALRKRGAEVGGVLIGSIERGEQAIVRIDDFRPVECDYRRGPTYILTDEDGARFEDVWARWQPDGSENPYAVGYYRSNTRESLAMGPADTELMDLYFLAEEHVALLVQPFATKASLAGFFVREAGKFPAETPLAFPFRRRELTGEEAPPRRPITEHRLPSARAPSLYTPPSIDTPEAAAPAPLKPRVRAGWVWIPLSFVFLLLGVLLGYQAALTRAAKSAAIKAEDFSLSLAVTRVQDNLTVKWSRDAAVVRAATRAVLEIEDGKFSKPVELDAAHLQSGSMIYRNSSDTVRFRLSVYLNARLSVTETLEWKQ